MEYQLNNKQEYLLNKQECQPLKHDVQLLYDWVTKKVKCANIKYKRNQWYLEQRFGYLSTIPWRWTEGKEAPPHTLDMAWHMQEVGFTLWSIYHHGKN
jgi:hypothetical protein